ncbi:ATPase family associated with various cellular activities (AAA) [Poriferisphaera corsica]|uniref:ATPase family associated with various cellular activities (AAA) n=1 Tax=Poriferisphaera corsica TaxID=2528020 RepID=A0A517YR01_9BACT|nr:AAA family ATPase [Poriferisphaera corsica]QDU32654.1 ATPase family associated with various cellular activities (AAA) [Poriferisphaera corsica]
MNEEQQVMEQVENFVSGYKAVREQVAKMIVGHDEIVDGVLTCLFVGGHCLLEGVPGLGKTLLIRSLSEALSLDFARIQFTPDLMPADITGTTIVAESKNADGSSTRSFQFQKGPIFSQIVLADEINRATPKTQSAMLESMQEKSVTVGGTTYPMFEPFFVMATQNPLEQEGTYPLPEAQLDRFFFKLNVGYSSRDELHEIMNRTTASAVPHIEPVMSAKQILDFQQLVRRVVIAPHVQDYAIRCVLATHPEGDFASNLTKQYVRVGGSPRAAQALVLGGKVRALLQGRAHVAHEDIKQILLPALRHRILLNFEGQAEGVTTDMVLNDIADNLMMDVAYTSQS